MGPVDSRLSQLVSSDDEGLYNFVAIRCMAPLSNTVDAKCKFCANANKLFLLLPNYVDILRFDNKKSYHQIICAPPAGEITHIIRKPVF